MRRPAMSGETALVTGGTRGIGWAIARYLAESGASVCIAGRNEELLRRREAELQEISPGSFAKVCDVRDEIAQLDLFKSLREQFRKLDVCVPNAGVAHLGSITTTELADWQRDIDTNLTGLFLTMREALRWMKEYNEGVILPVLSQASKQAFELRASYCASKWGGLGLVESARIEARKHNVRVTALLPASVATDFQAGNPSGTDWMLGADDVAEAVGYALSVSERVELPELWLRCWKKKRK